MQVPQGRQKPGWLVRQAEQSDPGVRTRSHWGDGCVTGVSAPEKTPAGVKIYHASVWQKELGRGQDHSVSTESQRIEHLDKLTTSMISHQAHTRSNQPYTRVFEA